MFRTISQTAINYRHSSLSEGPPAVLGAAIACRGRLPIRRTTKLRSARIVIGKSMFLWRIAMRLAEVCAKRGLAALHVITWGPKMRDSGLQRDAIYLVRPDGYVGLADEKRDPTALERYVDAHVIIPGVPLS